MLGLKKIYIYIVNINHSVIYLSGLKRPNQRISCKKHIQLSCAATATFGWTKNERNQSYSSTFTAWYLLPLKPPKNMFAWKA